MKSNALVKVCCLFSSILLVAVFVSYRAGTFKRLLNPSHPKREDQAFYSSKFGTIILESEARPKVKSEGPRAPDNVKSSDKMIIGGSKSLTPVISIEQFKSLEKVIPFDPAPVQAAPRTPKQSK